MLGLQSWSAGPPCRLTCSERNRTYWCSSFRRLKSSLTYATDFLTRSSRRGYWLRHTQSELSCHPGKIQWLTLVREMRDFGVLSASAYKLSFTCAMRKLFPRSHVEITVIMSTKSFRSVANIILHTYTIKEKKLGASAGFCYSSCSQPLQKTRL